MHDAFGNGANLQQSWVAAMPAPSKDILAQRHGWTPSFQPLHSLLEAADLPCMPALEAGPWLRLLMPSQFSGFGDCVAALSARERGPAAHAGCKHGTYLQQAAWGRACLSTFVHGPGAAPECLLWHMRVPPFY